MASGSNAPLINDALVAWPPPPSSARFATSPPQTARKQRFSIITPPLGGGGFIPAKYPAQHDEPLPSASASTSALGPAAPVSPRSPRSPKSPHRVPPIHVETDTIAEPPRGYGPPRRPLSPAQLSRIAQSFGIVVPPHPARAQKQPSPDPSRAPSRQRTASSLSYPATTSGHVVAVLPPPILLPAASGLDAEEQRARARRFRRGRLVPLQATLGAMLVAIAREFGLPSTTGINVYLGANGGAVRDDTDTSLGSEDDDPGPLITATTWTALFAHASREKSVSPASTPGSTPRKAGPRPFGGATLLTSPLTMTGDSAARGVSPTPLRVRTLTADTADDSSASSLSPRTPSRSQSLLPVFGTIEFEIDADEARWLKPWLAAGGSRRREPDVRELTLVERFKDARPRFVREEEEAREEARREERSRLEERSREEEGAREEAEAEAERRTVDEAEAVTERGALPEPNGERHGYSQLDDGELQGYAQLDDGSDYGSDAHENRKDVRLSSFPAPPIKTELEPMDELAELCTTRPANGPLTELDIGTDRALNGQLELDDDGVDENTRQMAEIVAMLDNRAGSGLPTPTEGNHSDMLASPIALPRANGEEGGRVPLQLPQLRGLATGQRGSGLVMADQLNSLEKMMRALSPRDIRSPRSPRFPNGIMADDLPPRGSSRLPYLQPEHSPSSPLAQRSVSAPHHSQHSPPAPIPPPKDFLPQRSVSEAPPRPISQAPPRPARPPTPDLTDMQDIDVPLPHVLPSGLAEGIQRPSPVAPAHVHTLAQAHVPFPTPPPSSFASASSPTSPQGHDRRQSRNSISLRGLRRVSSRVLRDAPFQRQASDGGAGIHPAPSSFAYRTGSEIEEDRPKRFFGFRRTHQSPTATPAEEKRMTITHISGPFGAAHKHISPAELAAGLVPPLPSGGVPGTPRISEDRRDSHPTSPGSLKNVRRKPVPGLDGDAASIVSGSSEFGDGASPRN